MKTPALNKLIQVTLATLTIGLLNSLNAYSQENTVPYRPVQEGDFCGLWEQVDTRGGSVKDLSNPWYSAPQLYSFSEEGYMKKLIKRGGALTDTDLEQMELAPNTTRFQVNDETGCFKISYEEGIVYKWLGTYCLQDSQGTKAGDVIISCYDDPSTEEPLFYRLLRKRSTPNANE